MEEKSDMYVTALDIFGRRAYFESQQNDFESSHATRGGARSATPVGRERIAHCDPAPSAASYNEHDTSFREGLNESAVCKLKHFSSPQTYAVANSVKDDLDNTLGDHNSTQIYVSKELLLEKRRSFFETLFTHTDELHTALPCRFSIDDIDQMFERDSIVDCDPSTLYRKRLAALERLRETLDC